MPQKLQNLWLSLMMLLQLPQLMLRSSESILWLFARWWLTKSGRLVLHLMREDYRLHMVLLAQFTFPQLEQFQSPSLITGGFEATRGTSELEFTPL